MTPVFCCGFECGVGSAAAHFLMGTSASLNTSIKRAGDRSVRINFTATNGGYVQSNSSIGAGTNVGVFRFYIYFATLPTADCHLFGVNVGTVNVVFKQSDSSIYAGYISGSSAVTGASGVAVTTGQWYRVDYQFNMSANPHVGDVAVDGTNCTQTTRALAANTWTTIRPAVENAGTTFDADVYYDDIICSRTPADYPIGAGYINHFIPTSDGTHNVAGANDFERTLTGTDILNSTTTAYQLVGTVPLQSGAVGSGVTFINMVAPPNATGYVQCIFGPASGISTPTVAPLAVEVVTAIGQAGTGTGNMEIRLNDNGTTNAVYTATTVAGVTTLAYKRKHYATAPTGGAWTIVSGNGNFNNLQVQFGSPAALDANPDQYFSSIMIEAEFAGDPPTPSAAIRDIIGIGIIPFAR